jgi:lactate dehydrogenase-like 2-hydroxyacid dehydrogenase
MPADVVMFGPKPIIVEALTKAGFTVHKAFEAPDKDAFLNEISPKIRAIAAVSGHGPVDGAIMGRFPKLEIVSSFGVGYDHIDAKWAAANNVMVTNTPDVLNEEVADTALGLTLCTVRELPQAEKYLRDGNWPKHGDYRLTPSLRDRTAGIVGMGRIGKAIGRRLEAMQVPVVYHSRRPAADVSYKHYPNLVDMARDVDLMIVITPGGAATKNLVNAEVLKALGSNGILINVARGSVVDEPALIDALKNKTILSAGLDVYPAEPQVSAELMAMDNIVLLPHVGSASTATRTAMDTLVANNIISWFAGKGPLTPVAETPVKK